MLEVSERRAQGAMFSACGVLLAAAFFGASLTPSLIPRDALMQGALGGVVAALGYEIGAWAEWLWRFMQLPGPPRAWRDAIWQASCYAALAIALYCLWFAADWQNATRAVMDLEPVQTSHPVWIAGVALAVFLLVWLVFRLFGYVLRRVLWALDRFLPPRVGRVLGFGLVLWLFWALIDGVLIRSAFRAADASFEAADELIEPDVPQPADPLKTGGAASLIEWEEMGRWGRAFVATAPTKQEIAEFAGPAAIEPVRVYVGRLAAETARERAELALEELIRAGGFDRAALVVAVPVGTGWMDPGAHDSLDFMLGGDVATVAVQYSYLTSVLSLWANPEFGVDQSEELFDVIYAYWAKLPPDARPKLYVHGLSQGAFNSQATLPLLDMLADPIQGAMWAGSPFFSAYWNEVRRDRHDDSPAWRPRYGNGSLVRTMNQDWGNQDGVEQFDAPWGPIRMVFLNYGSDPLVVFNSTAAIRRPDWLNPPRAPDVSPALRWFPLVTTFQLALDMAVSLKVPGFGHFYIARDYIDAWSAVVDPPGWSVARADQLKAIFEARGAPF